MFGYMALSLSRPIAEHFADAYALAAYFLFCNLLITCLNLYDFKQFDPRNLYVLYVFPVLVSVLHLAGYVTDGYRFEQNALMHNDGPLAMATDVYILCCCLGAVVALFTNVKMAKNKTNLSKNVVALISFIPLILSIFALLLLSRTQYALPVVVILPIFFLYTGMMFYYIAQDQVIDITIGVRFIRDRLVLCHCLLAGQRDKQKVKQLMKRVEWQFIKEALYEHDNNIMDTAEALGMNHNTIRTKIKEQEAFELSRPAQKNIRSHSL